MNLKDIYLKINHNCSNSFCYSVDNTSFDSSLRKIAVSPQVNLKQENNLVLEKERAIFLSLDTILQVIYKYKTNLSESRDTFLQDNNFRGTLPLNRKSLKRALNLNSNLNSYTFSLGNWFFSLFDTFVLVLFIFECFHKTNVLCVNAFFPSQLI